MYLTRLHFIHMITLATLIHFGILFAWSMMPHKQVPIIPVRALNIKLGGGDSPEPALPFSAPQMVMAAAEMAEMAPAAGAPNGRDVDPVLNSLEDAINRTQDTSRLEKVIKEKFRPKTPVDEPTLATAKPKKYVRAPSTGEALGNVDTGEEAITRYEQRLSLWLRQHKRYPREAEQQRSQGTATIRIWINRTGQILSYEILSSTGSSLLDRAVGDMIGRSNPVPPVPAGYPGGDRLAFQMDVDFTLEPR